MNEYQRRRRAFADQIGSGVAIIVSAPERIRSNDSEYPYRQNTDFLYLTGFEEPESVLVLAPAHTTAHAALFVRPNHADEELWNGRRAGLEGAKRATGVDVTYPISELAQRLPEFLETSDTLYFALGEDSTFDADILKRLKQYRAARARSGRRPVTIIDPAPILHELRLRKSSHDVAAMRRTCEISALGHIAAMRYARPGMHEYEVEAVVEYTFAANGAQSPAYPSIVASGANLGVIHYTANRDRIPDGSLVLVDAGAEVDYYNGDITRTWPINGTFSSEQRAVYEVVLAAQLRAIELTKPGAVFNTDVDNGAAAVLVAGLIDLGLLQGSADEHMTQQTHKRFTVHRIGHWLGMDTHDVGDYKVGGQWRPLEPGMVVTIEPGLYIPDAPDVDARFRGISVRIEDDALVTSMGCEILTAKAPKKSSDIERLMAEGRASAQALIA